MDDKDYHQSHIMNVRLKQKIISLVILGLVDMFRCYRLQFCCRSQIALRSFWHTGNEHHLLRAKLIKAVTSVSDCKNLKARLDQFLSVWKLLSV